MNRVVLGGFMLGSAYCVSFVSPNPSLLRVAADRAEPSQRALSVGFWGASAQLLIVGPDLDALYGRKSSSIPAGYPVTVVVNDVLRYERPTLEHALKRQDRRGYLRMIPSMWYGMRTEFPNRFVPDGRAACSGRFYWVPRRSPQVPPSWRLVSQQTVRVKLPLKCEYPATGGGGAGFVLYDPPGWRLAEIGISAGERYVAPFSSVWGASQSEWIDPKPHSEREAMARYRFVPVVWAEVIRADLQNEMSGERRSTVTPTGWIETAASFQRNDRGDS